MLDTFLFATAVLLPCLLIACVAVGMLIEAADRIQEIPIWRK